MKSLATTLIERIEQATLTLKEIYMEATRDYGAIGWAVSHARHGHHMRRQGWNAKNLYIVYAPPNAIQLAQKFGGGYNTTAAIFMKTADDELVPWLCSQTDLLATDWEMVDAPQPGETHA